MSLLKKATKETMQFGGTMLKLFKDIVQFFETQSSSKSTDKMIEVGTLVTTFA